MPCNMTWSLFGREEAGGGGGVGGGGEGLSTMVIAVTNQIIDE